MITDEDKRTFRRLGFTWNQINGIDAAVDLKGKPQPYIDINGTFWKDVQRKHLKRTKRRKKEWERVHGRPINRKTLDELTDQWYQKTYKDIWAWLKEVYRKFTKKPRGTKVVANTKRARQKRR